jgi:hypothetical protein
LNPSKDFNVPDAFIVFTWCFALDSAKMPSPSASAWYRDTVANVTRTETARIARKSILCSFSLSPVCPPPEKKELMLKRFVVVVVFFFFVVRKGVVW